MGDLICEEQSKNEKELLNILTRLMDDMASDDETMRMSPEELDKKFEKINTYYQYQFKREFISLRRLGYNMMPKNGFKFDYGHNISLRQFLLVDDTHNINGYILHVDPSDIEWIISTIRSSPTLKHREDFIYKLNTAIRLFEEQSEHTRHSKHKCDNNLLILSITMFGMMNGIALYYLIKECI